MLIRTLFIVCWTCFYATSILRADESVTALVASSTKDAIGEIAKAFEADTGIDVNISPGASNALAQQIIHGAPADVFVSASPEWMDAVAREGLVSESHPLAGNQLVVIVPKDTKTNIASPGDLLNSDVKRIALAGESVPAGKYAEQALRFHDVFDILVPKIVRGTDVRSAMAYAERGEVDAGIVYATDARLTGNVRVAYTFDEESHDPILYPAALLRDGANKEAAKRFYAYLRSEAAGEIFAQYGFAAAREGPTATSNPSETP
jgi:molybdate transport system substrate-binding protein